MKALPLFIFAVLSACSSRGEEAREQDAGAERADARPDVGWWPGCDPDRGCPDAGDSGAGDASRASDAGTDASLDTGMADVTEVEPYCPLADEIEREEELPSSCITECETAPRTVDPCATAERLDGGSIIADATWSGVLCAGTNLLIRAGVTVTVMPGTEIYFDRSVTLAVEGHLSAEGTEGAPILFSASGVSPFTGFWGGISVQLSEGGTLHLEESTVEYAEWGVGQWEYTSDPTFAEDLDRVVIRRSLLRFNDWALATDDNTVLTASTIVCNSWGVHVSSEDTPIERIEGNNICHNVRWGMAAVQDDVDASGNYWCSTDLDVVRGDIYEVSDRTPGASGPDGAVILNSVLPAPAPGAPALP